MRKEMRINIRGRNGNRYVRKEEEGMGVDMRKE